MAKINCNIIICGPAVGKTYLSSIDGRFIDLDEIKATYKYGLENLSLFEKEKGKLNREKVVNENSTNYAINILNEQIKNDKIILLSHTSKKVIDYIISNKMKYCLVYPGIESFIEYEVRMKKRGNNSIFIEKMTNKETWKNFYYSNVADKNATYKVELKNKQYLSDIRNMFFY